MTHIFDMTGRASRSEFWAVNFGVMIFQWVAVFTLMFVMGSELNALGLNGTKPAVGSPEAAAALAALQHYKWPFLAIMLLPMIPQLIVSWRRLKDRGASAPRAGLFFGFYAGLWYVFAETGAVPFFLILNFTWPLLLAVSAWYYIELGCLPGKPAPTDDTPTNDRAAPAVVPRPRSASLSASTSAFGRR